jgi:hypothetical protein
MKVLGFDKSPFTKTDIGRLVGILPEFMTDDVATIAFSNNLPEGYKLKDVEHSKVRTLILPEGESKKIMFIAPGHDREHDNFFYAARFLGDFLRAVSLGSLQDQTRADLVAKALAARPAERTDDSWRMALIRRLCAKGSSLGEALELCREVEEVMAEFAPDFNLHEAAFDLAHWHQAILKRLAGESVRRMVNASLEDKYARAGWLHRILHSDTPEKYGKALPKEVAHHLRALLNEGEAHRAASLNGLAEALQAYEA